MNFRVDNDKLIMIVDDEPMMVSFIEKILIDEGYRIVTAGDGNTALQLISKEEPDLILLDIRMPGADGVSTLERIRQLTNAPVIMVTGLGGDDLIERSIDTGADDFIRKPFRPNELLARIKAKLRRHR